MGQISDWFRHSAMRPRKITKVVPGQDVRIFNKEDSRRYIVDEVYPGFIRCHREVVIEDVDPETGEVTRFKTGKMEYTTFNLGDLVMNGYESIYL